MFSSIGILEFDNPKSLLGNELHPKMISRITEMVTLQNLVLSQMLTSRSFPPLLPELLTALVEQANRPPQNNLEIYWQQQDPNHSSQLLIVRATTQELAQLMFQQHNSKQKIAKQDTDRLTYIIKNIHEKSPNVTDLRPPKQPQSRNKRWDFTIRLSQRTVSAAITEIQKSWGQPVTTTSPTLKISHNLPHRPYLELIDRAPQIQQIHHWLQPTNQNPLIAIEGNGGIGKTALALEIAHHYLAEGSLIFDGIIFATVQPQQLLGKHLIPQIPHSYSLSDLLRSINFTLTGYRELPPSSQDQIKQICNIIRDRQPLIIVDNIESLAQQTELLDFLRQLPTSAKVIVTSREHLGLPQTIFLEPIAPNTTQSWITKQLRQRQISLKNTQISELTKATGGFPLAIESLLTVITNQYHSPNPLQFLQNLQQSTQIIHEFCFSTHLQSLTDSAQHILFTLTFLVAPIPFAALQQITQLPRNQLLQGLAELRKCHFIDPLPHLQNEGQSEVSPLHSLLNSYIQEQLAQQPDQEQALRKQWISYYQNFAATYRDRYWLEWHDYNALTADWPNLRAAVDWCQQQDRYADLRHFWQSLRGFTLLRGHWIERQNWIDYLLAAAQQRQDQNTAADAIFQVSQTLAFGNEADPEDKALELALDAWQKGQDSEHDWKFNVALLIAVLYLRKQSDTPNYDPDAEVYIGYAQELAQQMANHELAQYHRCQILYYQAELHANRSELEAALEKYQQALELSQLIGYQRCIAYCTGRRAKILFYQQKFHPAQSALMMALEQAEKYQDQRSIAFCCFYLFQLPDQNSDQSEQYAQRASTIFSNLGMDREADMVKTLQAHGGH